MSNTNLQANCKFIFIVKIIILNPIDCLDGYLHFYAFGNFIKQERYFS